jgi:hypothetical protein
MKAQDNIKNEDKYFYYRVEFKDCGLEFDYVICKSLNQVLSCLKYVDAELDDDTKEVIVTVRGIGMTKQEYRDYIKSCANEED